MPPAIIPILVAGRPREVHWPRPVDITICNMKPFRVGTWSARKQGLQRSKYIFCGICYHLSYVFGRHGQPWPSPAMRFDVSRRRCACRDRRGGPSCIGHSWCAAERSGESFLASAFRAIPTVARPAKSGGRHGPEAEKPKKTGRKRPWEAIFLDFLGVFAILPIAFSRKACLIIARTAWTSGVHVADGRCVVPFRPRREEN